MTPLSNGAGGPRERSRTLLVSCLTMELCLMIRLTSMTGQCSGEQLMIIIQSFYIYCHGQWHTNNINGKMG